jgi:hypothetical protein
MSKRLREASFSPTADSGSDVSKEDSEDTRPVKINAVVRSDPHEPVMQCSLPPHRQALSFDSIDAFEVHYQKDHSNRCSSCSKNFPSSHFLSLHLDESHNPLRAELQAKGEKTYGCFVEDCEKKCSTPQKRRLHLIDKHLFPKSYNFQVISTGIDRSTSMLTEPKTQRRRVSTTGAPADHVTRHRRTSSQLLDSIPGDNRGNRSGPRDLTTSASAAAMRASTPDQTNDLDDLTKNMSALRFIPQSVRKQNARKSEP